MFPRVAAVALCLSTLAQAQQPTAPILRADPVDALIDTPVRITVSGLLPKQPFRITATSRTSTDRALIAYAVFQSDDSGNIDVPTAKPLEGSHSKPDAMGLFWSMAPQPVLVTIRSLLNLQPFRPPAPWTVLLEVAPERGGSLLATLRIVRRYANPALWSVDVREQALVGKLMLPSQGIRRPGVILLGGSEGGFDEAGAALLASHGYAAFALAYFGQEGLPSELVEIPVEYAIRAVKWLRARPDIDPDRIAIIGRSRGSELALLTASLQPEVEAVVAISPSSVLWGGIPKSPRPSPVAAWTYEGKPLPLLSADAPSSLVQEFFAKGALQSRLYDYLFSDKEALERATIPIERIRSQVLLISGKEDRVWGSPIMAQKIMDRAQQFDHAASFVHLSYDGAGHNIREPYRPTPDSRASAARPKDMPGPSKTLGRRYLRSWQPISSNFG